MARASRWRPARTSGPPGAPSPGRPGSISSCSRSSESASWVSSGSSSRRSATASSAPSAPARKIAPLASGGMARASSRPVSRRRTAGIGGQRQQQLGRGPAATGGTALGLAGHEGPGERPLDARPRAGQPLEAAVRRGRQEPALAFDDRADEAGPVRDRLGRDEDRLEGLLELRPPLPLAHWGERRPDRARSGARLEDIVQDVLDERREVDAAAGAGRSRRPRRRTWAPTRSRCSIRSRTRSSSLPREECMVRAGPVVGAARVGQRPRALVAHALPPVR